MRTDIGGAGLSFLSVAVLAFAGGCAPDNSVGSDTVLQQGGGGGAPAAQAGAASGGAPVATSAGAGGSGAVAGADAVAGNGGSPVSGAGTGGTSAGGGTSGGSSTGGTSGSGAAGGGVVGSAGMGGPSLCPVSGTTLCDGFENAAPGAATSPFTVQVGKAGDTMAVDTTKFYRGSKSMKFSAASSAFIVASKIFTGTTKATNNNLWGRYFILSNVTAATTYDQGHVVFGALADAMNGGDQFHFVGGSRGKLQAEIRLTGDSYTDSMKMPAASDPSYPLLADGWQCWEFQVKSDDSFDFYINSAEVMEMKIVAGKGVLMPKTSFSPMPIFGGLYLGWQSFGAASAVVSGWIDEVAVGPTRIGCGS